MSEIKGDSPFAFILDEQEELRSSMDYYIARRAKFAGLVDRHYTVKLKPWDEVSGINGMSSANVGRVWSYIYDWQQRYDKAWLCTSIAGPRNAIVRIKPIDTEWPILVRIANQAAFDADGRVDMTYVDVDEVELVEIMAYSKKHKRRLDLE